MPVYVAHVATAEFPSSSASSARRGPSEAGVSRAARRRCNASLAARTDGAADGTRVAAATKRLVATNSDACVPRPATYSLAASRATAVCFAAVDEKETSPDAAPSLPPGLPAEIPFALRALDTAAAGMSAAPAAPTAIAAPMVAPRTPAAAVTAECAITAARMELAR